MSGDRKDDSAITSRLRDARREFFGAGGTALASTMLGVSQQTWENYESGVVMPAPVLLRFLVVTRVRPEWLLTGEGPKFGGQGGESLGPSTA